MMNMHIYLQNGFQHPFDRMLQAERQLTKSMLMYPIFVTDRADEEEQIDSMPGQRRVGVNKLAGMLEPLVKKGLQSVLLFGVPLLVAKDQRGTSADDTNGPVITAIKYLRSAFPNLYLAADVCLCEYTSHGHCGILADTGIIDNESSIQRIAEVALAYARAGVHCVAPSDMSEGRVHAIKSTLVRHSLKVCVMSYAAKFATCLYGPFRDAAKSEPGFGDRKGYQLPPVGRGLARRAIQRDLSEGADIIMVKPAGLYLDILADARHMNLGVPLAAYQVSGEYAMIHAAATAKVLDLRRMVEESLNAILRAGGTLIITYFTPELLDWLGEIE